MPRRRCTAAATVAPGTSNRWATTGIRKPNST
ncbi:hypothetical protein ACWGMO_33235, partial [Nocardia salmonicida]